MSWIGLTDLNVTSFDQTGIGAHTQFPFDVPKDGLLPTGSLIFETTFSARYRVPQRILRYEHRDGWERYLSVAITAEGALSVDMRQGEAQSHAQLTMPPPPQDTRLRITYSWDAPGRRALLTVEDLDQGLLYQSEMAAPIPLPLIDAYHIIKNGPLTRIGRDTRFIAISDKVEPVGLMLGVAKGTPVETPTGPQFVDRLRLGDLVTTGSGVPQPVRWIIKREVPMLGRFRPVRLRAPYYGLTRDIFCAPDHRIMLTGAEAEYLFGESHVLVEAMHLVDGKSVLREHASESSMWYYHILLDSHECLKYAGLWGESLFVGAIGRSQDLIATTPLADMPFSALPRHTRFALPILSGLESTSLVQARSA